MRPAPGGSYGRSTNNQHQLPSDERMRAWRMAGKFICQCRWPKPHHLGAWDAKECRDCGKPIFNTHQAEELIRLVLDEVEP